jgi:hypothetical protein
VIRPILPVIALLTTCAAIAQPKVSDGGTPPAGGGATAQPASPDKPAPPAADREAARKALDALKGGKATGKPRQDERKPGSR